MFKILIEGKTIKDLKANVDEFIREFEDLQPRDKTEPSQEISSEHAAIRQDLPNVSAELARSIPTTPIISETLISPATPVVPPAVVKTFKAVSAGENEYGVDSRGLPWDERIHSVSQGVNKNGTWRYKRGIEDSMIRNVEAELATQARVLQSTSVPNVPDIDSKPPVVPNVPAIPPVAAVSPAPSMSHLTVVPVAVAPPPIPPPQPVVPSAHTLETFKATLVPTLAKLVRDGKLDQDYLKQLCAHYGVDMLFKVNEEQLKEVFQGFVQYGLIVQAL